jgi:hypothetical protein
MKKINFIKISLDILMSVTFALLFNKMVLGGIVFHEVAGTAIGAAFILHMGLNWRWIKQVTSKIFSSKISIKTRIGYIVDILLLITMIITIISGIAISKVLYSGINFGNSMFFKTAHMSVPYIALILLGVHIGLHWTWIMNVFKKIFKITPGKKSLNYIAKLAVILVLAFGSYSIYNINFFSRVSMVTGIFSTSQLPGGKDMASRQLSKDGLGEPNKMTEGNFQGKQAPGNIKNGQLPNKSEGKGLSVNPLNVVSSNLGVIGVFTIITFYIEKLLMIKKLKRKVNV